MLTDDGKPLLLRRPSILVALAPEVTLTDRLFNGRLGGRSCGAVGLWVKLLIPLLRFFSVVYFMYTCVCVCAQCVCVCVYALYSLAHVET